STMLRTRDLASGRAALLYRREEICPHDAWLARPYLAVPDAEPLTAAELDALRDRFQPEAVRYALHAPAADVLADKRLLTTGEVPPAAPGAIRVVTVILSG